MTIVWYTKKTSCD